MLGLEGWLRREIIKDSVSTFADILQFLVTWAWQKKLETAGQCSSCFWMHRTVGCRVLSAASTFTTHTLIPGESLKRNLAFNYGFLQSGLFYLQCGSCCICAFGRTKDASQFGWSILTCVLGPTWRGQYKDCLFQRPDGWPCSSWAFDLERRLVQILVRLESLHWKLLD